MLEAGAIERVVADILRTRQNLICVWCFVLALTSAQDNGFYEPQTFKQHIEEYKKGLFTPANRIDVSPQSTVVESWRPKSGSSFESWPGPSQHHQSPAPAPVHPQPEPWRMPYALTKEQQANILHHKQALSSEGSFRFEYASDNGLSAGEVIEPDGSRVGSYQYKDPSGQLVKLKYKAGKDGFQILEGSHLPKSPEPVPPLSQGHYYQEAYEQQRRQYDLQQQYNQQKIESQGAWKQGQGHEAQRAASGPPVVQHWRANEHEDDGQYRENNVENKGPHSFGEGYAFAFQG
ncbi:cuticular protein RR-1 motif 48 [Aphomia sociella]